MIRKAFVVKLLINRKLYLNVLNAKLTILALSVNIALKIVITKDTEHIKLRHLEDVVIVETKMLGNQKDFVQNTKEFVNLMINN